MPRFIVFNKYLIIFFLVAGILSVAFWGHVVFNTYYGTKCICYGVKVENSCRGLSANCGDIEK